MFKVISPPKLPRNAKVIDLIMEDGLWNMQKINDHFGREDSEAIANICLSPIKRDDLLVWYYDSKGEYTVRSGYHIATKIDSADYPSGSSSDRNKNFWRMLWSLDLPKKIKIFLWRSSHRAIPTHQALFRRNITKDHICPICRSHEDTIQHAKMVWRKTGWKQKLSWNKERDFIEIIEDILENQIDAEEFVSIAWSIWYVLNAAIHESRSFTVGETI